MPELPDVEVMKQYLDATALHQEIAGVEVKARDETLFPETPVERLAAGLEGRTFQSTRRHGKYLLVELDAPRWLVLHFGMTGDLKYFKHEDKEPEYDRFLVHFANGYHLAYVSQRKIGEIEFVDSPQALVEEKDLGPDAAALELDEFKQLLSGRRGMIKSALMDQQLLAGIGNVYSDEILFQVGVHPRTQVGDLPEETIERIYRAMNEVLETAVEHRAIPDDFPQGYIVPHRHGDGRCPRCGAELRHVKVSGRTAYYCPEHQPEPEE